MKKLYFLFAAQMLGFAVFAQQKVGINNPTPGFALDVFDAANQGFFTNFVSNNQNNVIMQIQGNYSPAVNNTAYIGMGLYRNGGGKGYLVLDGSNNLILSANISAFPHLAITPAGNVGIGRTDAGFPISLPNTLGDKIGLYGTSGNSYGFGVQTNVLQVHTDVSGSDIAFGYGSSAAMTERMRIRGNGYIGIATNNPSARLDITQQGLYSRTEGQGHGLEIRDTTGTDHILYMGADGANQVSYIQSVASGGFRDLLLEGRGGSVIVGKDQGSVLQVKGDLVTDYSGNNNGSTGYALRFGSSSSGEAIGSKRNGGGNQNGLDFYTAGTNRLQIANNGNITIPGNIVLTGTINNYQALVSEIGGQRQKMLLVDAGLSSPGGGYPQGYIGAATYGVGSGVFITKPVAWVTSFTGSGDCHKVVITTEVVANGAGWDIKLHTTNTSTGVINFNGIWKVAIMGAY
ncbi:MAG: hypothetical protein ABIX01_01175 [Chitinophagaceae bacterium]